MTTEFPNSENTLTSSTLALLARISKATELFTTSGAKMNPGQLSESRVTLASLYCSLGECVASARKDSDIAEFESKKAKLSAYKTYRSLNSSGVDSKTYSEYDSLELTLEAIMKKYDYERLKNIHDGTSEMLNAMSSRLRVLEGEKRNS